MVTRSAVLLAALALALMLVVSACDVPQEEMATVETAPTRLNGLVIYNGLTRFTDDEAGVVCWVLKDYYMNGYGIGLSCLPIRETLLGATRQGAE